MKKKSKPAASSFCTISVQNSSVAKALVSPRGWCQLLPMKFGVNSSNAPRTSCLGMMCLSGEVSGRADPGDRECGRRAAGARAEQECDQGHHVRQGEEQLVREIGRAHV